jgi:hypothetical protein
VKLLELGLLSKDYLNCLRLLFLEKVSFTSSLLPASGLRLILMKSATTAASNSLPAIVTFGLVPP